MGPAVFQTGLARENIGLQPFPFAREPIGLVGNMSTKLLYGTQTEKWGSAGVSPEAWPPRAPAARRNKHISRAPW
jgi:hypothetical protein